MPFPMPVTMVMVMVMVVVVSLDTAVTVGPSLRIEGGDERCHPSPETLHHVLDHMVAPNAQRAGNKLGRQVAVAQVPGNAQQGVRRRGLYLDKVLGRGEHRDDAPVRKPQAVAVMKVNRLRHVEEHLRAARAIEHGAAAVPVLPVKHDTVGRGGFPGAGGQDFRDRYHALSSASAARFIAARNAGRFVTRAK